MVADVNDLIKSITADVKTIVRSEIELAKSELIPSGKNAGIGAGMFGGAGYTGLNAASLLFMASGFGIGCLFEALLHWPILGAAALGFVIMAIILLIITGILAMIGKGRFAKVKGPEKTQAQAVATVNESKAAIERGTEDVNSGRALESYLVEQDHRRTDIVPLHPSDVAGYPAGSRGDRPAGSFTGATRADVAATTTDAGSTTPGTTGYDASTGGATAARR